MEYCRPHPGVDANKGPTKVKRFHRVIVRHSSSDLGPATPMSEEVEQRKEDRGWLLRTRKPPEWPFSMILHYGLTSHNVPGSNVLHACVLAIFMTRPIRQSQHQWHGVCRLSSTILERAKLGTSVEINIPVASRPKNWRKERQNEQQYNPHRSPKARVVSKLPRVGALPKDHSGYCPLTIRLNTGSRTLTDVRN